MNNRFEKHAATAGLLGIAFVLTACQSGPVPRYASSRIATVEILTPVTIPPGRARAVFQDGRAVDGAYPYDPYCELEISTVSEQPQQVQKDLLVVTRAGTAVLSDPVARLPLAGPFVDLECGDKIYYETTYWLASDRQPGVRKLSCLQAFNACWGEGHHQDRDSIKHALGPGFKID